MFSIIIPLLDPQDRFASTGVLNLMRCRFDHLVGKFEVIIVSNNRNSSTPQLLRWLEQEQRRTDRTVKVVLPDCNLGTARGFNAGWRIADADSQYLVFMSSDADIVDPNMLQSVSTVMTTRPDIGIAHPYSIYEDSDKFNISRKYSVKKLRQMIREQRSSDAAELNATEIEVILRKISVTAQTCTPMCSTPLTFAIYRRAMLDELQGFDEGVQYGCYETEDLSFRALRAGYQVVRMNTMFINHRRLLVRGLVLESSERVAMPHRAIIAQSHAWWTRKWGRPYAEIYFQWRWGSLWFTIARPYFIARRIASMLKRRIGA
jgi:GT2 family glycosyltransferase